LNRPFLIAGIRADNAGTCFTNGPAYAYQPFETCTVDVTFTPKAPGLRQGAVQLLDKSGNVLATAFVQGT
jgi:large repetitive protein